ncbi:MAG: type II toxin-antitoxin system prevent-host-death family antitoxin [Acidobacteriota bacterium]
MNAHIVEVTQAQGHLDDLVDEAVKGIEVVISRAGLPVAKLVPFVSAAKARQFGSARGLLTISEDFGAPIEDFRGYV